MKTNKQNTQNNVSRNVSRVNNQFDNAMLKAIGMEKVAAWVPSEEKKSKERKDRYRRKLAVSGIKQLNIQVPDAENVRGTFNKLASAVRNDVISTDKLDALIEDPEKADMALQVVSAIQNRTPLSRLIWGLLKFLLRWQSNQDASKK